MSAENVSRRGLWILLAVFAAGWFCNLGYRHLVKPDEGRYAEISREMVASGDWLTPRLNGFKYFEKPALQYWATAAAFSAFGQSEWVARLWPGLTGFLGVLLVFWAGNRLFGPPAGLFGAVVAAGSALYVFIGHVLTLDMALTFFMSAAVFAIALAQRDGVDDGERRRWMLVAWSAAALAVLSKGLVGIVLPVAAVGLYILIERDWKRLAQLHAVPGGVLFLLISAPWFIAVSMANPEFFRFFFIQEHFERFLTKHHGRYEPFWFFVPVLLGGIVPWVVSLVPALRQAWTRAPSANFQPQRFLLLWCATVFVFFSASGSKLGSYILPLFPALALLVGRYLAVAGSRVMLAQAIVSAAVGIAIVAASLQAVHYAEPGLPPELLSAYAPWLAAAGAALFGGAALSAWLCMRARPLAASIALAFGGLVAMQAGLSGHEQLSPAYSAYHIVQKIRDQLKPDVPFYVVDNFDHTLPFYLGRTVTMVAHKDELGQAISWEPQKFLPDMEAFARAWQADREAFAMFTPRDFDKFRISHPLPMQVIASDPRRVIVKKP